MSDETNWINAVEMSRRLRIETGEKLAQMTREERLRFFRDMQENDPVLRKMKRYTPSGYREDPAREAK